MDIYSRYHFMLKYTKLPGTGFVVVTRALASNYEYSIRSQSDYPEILMQYITLT